jgi:hypothetical protein
MKIWGTTKFAVLRGLISNGNNICFRELKSKFPAPVTMRISTKIQYVGTTARFDYPTEMAGSTRGQKPSTIDIPLSIKFPATEANLVEGPAFPQALSGLGAGACLGTNIFSIRRNEVADGP